MAALTGLIMNLIIGNALWTIISVVIVKLVPINTRLCVALNCFPDGTAAVGMLILGWQIILVFIWLGCLLNYLVVRSNEGMQNTVM